MNNIKSNWLIIVIIALLASFVGYQIALWNQPSKVTESADTAKPDTRKKITDIEIEIPQTYIDSSKIKVENAPEGHAAAEVMAPAVVSAVPGSEATIIARASGTVAKINKRLGDPVKAGEVLAVVDSMEATGMTAERHMALAKVELARKNFQRESRLFEQGITPRQEMESAQSALAIAEAEADKANMLTKAARVGQDGHTILVVSPVNGRITTESVIIGSFVQPDSSLFRVADHTQIQIEAYVTATDLLRIEPGDKASLMTRTGKTVNATVRSLTPTVNGGNQAATVILIPDEDSSSFVIGEGIQVRLHTKVDSGKHLLISEDAIQNLEGQDVVFVRSEKGFKPVPVVVGTRSGGLAEILSGIEKDTPVATVNAFLIKAEMIKSSPEDEE